MGTSNLLIGDAWFKQNPDKIIGEQEIVKGKFGPVIRVRGTLSDVVERIDAVPLKVIDTLATKEVSNETKQAAIDKVFTAELKEVATKRSRAIKQTTKRTPDKGSQEYELFTTREIAERYNPHITRDEMEAYYFTHPELNHRLVFDEFTNTKEDLISKKLICFESGKWIYFYSYVSGDVGMRISGHQRDKESFIAQHGEELWQTQMDMLTTARPKQKGLVGSERLVILPHSSFAKEIKISSTRTMENNYERSIYNTFKSWINTLTPDAFDNSNSREIISYYLENKAVPEFTDDKQKNKRNEINVKQRTKEVGDKLFAQFLSEELLPEDQTVISGLWNQKYNGIVAPNLDKIPVVFRINKTFKTGPTNLNETQRRAVAFQMERFSGLLAYGVGVGKTLAAEICLSAAIENGLAKRGVFVVPTNTYYKWIGEITGYYTEDGTWMHGALPHLNCVGLFNLNPTIVKETLKIYSADEQAQMDAVIELTGKIKKLSGDLTAQKAQELSRIYAISYNGLANGYMEYKELTSSATPKAFNDYVVDYLREEYNYLIYSLGKIKPFPDGTIFVTTEVGLQRLGLNEENTGTMTTQFYEILSQGEKTFESTGKNNEREIAKLMERINKTVASSMKNAKINIEDLGIDWCCFDEAHYYKKLFTYVKGDITGEKEKYDSRTGQVKSLGVKRDKAKYELKSGQFPSSRALSAFVLSQYVQRTNGNRNSMMLTATPFTNSPLEVYSMLVLTNFRALQEMNLSNMVDFFDTFMRINYDIKYTPQKTIVKDVVLTGYNNLPQLRMLIYSLMDKQDEGANLKRPEKVMYPSVQHGRETTIPMTGAQEAMMDDMKAYIQGNAEFEAICREALSDELETFDFDSLPDEDLISIYESSTGKDFEGERSEISEARRQTLIKQIKSAKSAGFEIEEDGDNKEESLGVRILKSLTLMRQITLSPFMYTSACKRAAKVEVELPHYKEFVETSPKINYAFQCVKSAIDFQRSSGEKLSGHVFYIDSGVDYFPLILQYAVKELGLSQSQVGMVTGKMSKGAKENAKSRFLSGDIVFLVGSSTISVGIDLQNNACTLYNLFYTWNPTDAQQIEGRIWRQGNRHAHVRIVYPQCYNSADPIIFQYLNDKTLRINEIWDRGSEKQELDLKDFDPKKLQRELITDPEEKASLEILVESEDLQNQISFFDNRKTMLENSMHSSRMVKKMRPEIDQTLSDLDSRRKKAAKAKAIEQYQDKVMELLEKATEKPEQQKEAIDKLYNPKLDTEGRFIPVDYATMPIKEVYKGCLKWRERIQKMTREDADVYGEYFYSTTTYVNLLNEFRSNYKEMAAAEERILKPLGLTFETASNPLADVDAKKTELSGRLELLEASKEDRIARIKAEQAAAAPDMKGIADRVAEFAAANEQYITPQLVYNTAAPIEIPKPSTEELIVLEKTVATKEKKPAKAKAEEKPQEKVEEPKPEAQTVNRADSIRKQIKALNLAKVFNANPLIDKQIRALELALKVA